MTQVRAHPILRVAGLVVVLAVAAACSEEGLMDVTPEPMLTALTPPAGPETNGDIPAHRATVCVNAPSGTFSFSIGVASGGPASDTSVPDATPTIAAGACETVATTRTPAGTHDAIQVEYQEEAGFLLDGVRRFTVGSVSPGNPPVEDAFAGPAVSHDQFNLFHPVVFIFDIEVFVVGDQGCTPGFWRNRGLDIGAWEDAGYDPDATVESVFADVSPRFPGLADQSLVGALAGGGGPGDLGGARILLRAAIAAVLNAEHPDMAYPRTESQVVDAVNDALRDGSRAEMLALAGDLDTDNNLGCPL